MKKTTQTTNQNEITVKIGRFNQPTKTVILPEDATVEEALEKAGISLNSSETLWVEGVEAEFGDILEDGDNINIVARKEGGNN